MSEQKPWGESMPKSTDTDVQVVVAGVELSTFIVEYMVGTNPAIKKIKATTYRMDDNNSAVFYKPLTNTTNTVVAFINNVVSIIEESQNGHVTQSSSRTGAEAQGAESEG